MNVENNCDTTPIHKLNSVQSYGALLGFTWPDGRIQVISQNLPAFLGRTQNELLGSKVEYVFEASFLSTLSDAVKRHPWNGHGLHLERPAVFGQTLFDTYIYHSDGLFVVELEPLVSQVVENEDQALVLKFTQEAKKLKSVVELSRLACRTIRQITGLDRVMMYKFAPPEWHGEVIAEDRITSVHSYIGHRFPATDIPLPARTLYLRNQVRLIADVNAQPVALIPELHAKTSRPMDLSDSRLRASAPIHIEYLKNMGVFASFSIAVTEGEKLWGLITCHHMKPLQISQTKRELCELVANFCSMKLCLIEESVRLENQIEFDFKLRKLEENLLIVQDPIDQFFRQHRTVTETFDGSGVALVGDTLIDFAGLTPLKADLESLAVFLRKEMRATNQSSIAIENLTSHSEDWKGLKDYVCGVLAVEIPELGNAVLMILRPEMIQTISWGGDPRKNLDRRNFGGEIHPRQSFQTWQEKIEFQSRSWKSYEVEALKFFRDFIFKTFLLSKATAK